MWASRSSVQGGAADERKCRMQRETVFRVDVMQVWRERRLEGGGTDWQCCRYGRTRAGRRQTTERGGRGHTSRLRLRALAVDRLCLCREQGPQRLKCRRSGQREAQASALCAQGCVRAPLLAPLRVHRAPGAYDADQSPTRVSPGPCGAAIATVPARDAPCCTAAPAAKMIDSAHAGRQSGCVKSHGWAPFRVPGTWSVPWQPWRRPGWLPDAPLEHDSAPLVRPALPRLGRFQVLPSRRRWDPTMALATACMPLIERQPPLAQTIHGCN